MEDLLVPRYKVIADYPGNDEYTVGSIKTNLGESYCKHLDQYPHLFRKMEWWEDRKPEEIQFVKLVVDIPYWQMVKGEVHKVKMIYKQPIWLFDLEKAKWVKPTALLPATLSEYLNQNH